eukprot:GHVT01010987.1.p2 GENE.GHVT01010987.1~~GHVT01010987.1.p2  ORF type:complete len:111 (-),score=7.63 GHVT01010987.1:1274-1606(-)
MALIEFAASRSQTSSTANQFRCRLGPYTFTVMSITYFSIASELFSSTSVRARTAAGRILPCRHASAASETATPQIPLRPSPDARQSLTGVHTAEAQTRKITRQYNTKSHK